MREQDRQELHVRVCAYRESLEELLGDGNCVRGCDEVTSSDSLPTILYHGLHHLETHTHLSDCQCPSHHHRTIGDITTLRWRSDTPLLAS